MLRENDHVDGGTLVYDVWTEHHAHLLREVKIGRQLLGFANVTDWARSARNSPAAATVSAQYTSSLSSRVVYDGTIRSR
ncbi:hypothetical protein [Halohasta litorea]|uniref:Uncharacterized protein n=1 Tax=Halohasta litorea TaxID=869891 RepID=A0ABD6DBH4_9EURY|nr:hypothetical protein [Halohasta litorea]